jgi:lysophospholipase L1-like esterase
MRLVPPLALLILTTPALAADPFFFQKGDRVMFLGDSITEQYQYSTDIELYLTTRFPDWNLTFLNAGIGGDTANGGAGRFQEHVLTEKPTAVTINFGMNDAGYGKFDPARNKQYVEKTAAMLDMARKAGVRVALISPNAVDRRGRENFKLYVETQKEFYAPLKDLAGQYGTAFVDQYAVTRAALEKMERDHADKVVPFGDGFHTASPGGLLMAHAILTGLGAPARVSDVVIDAGAKTATPERCKVENLTVSADAVSFDRTDEALPVPVQKDWLTLLPYVNDLKDLNYYGLTVKGLPKGIWGISIGGVEVARASADDLEGGQPRDGDRRPGVGAGAEGVPGDQRQEPGRARPVPWGGHVPGPRLAGRRGKGAQAGRAGQAQGADRCEAGRGVPAGKAADA